MLSLALQLTRTRTHSVTHSSSAHTHTHSPRQIRWQAERIAGMNTGLVLDIQHAEDNTHEQLVRGGQGGVLPFVSRGVLKGVY